MRRARPIASLLPARRTRSRIVVAIARGLAALAALVLLVPLVTSAAGPPPVTTVVVRHVTGDVRTGADSGGSVREVKVGDLPPSGASFQTGATGALTLRFHPDLTLVELAPSSRATLIFSDADSGTRRRVTLQAGRAVARVTALARATPLTFEDHHATVLMNAHQAGKVAFRTSDEAATLVVLEGEAEVVNRKSGVKTVVKRGDKAVTGSSGTDVTRASSRELMAAGQRQNVLEVDFWNPATEEFRTLEIEYEASPRGP